MIKEIKLFSSTHFNRFHQAFFVLNSCRVLQDLYEGRVTSKLDGVKWAKEHLDPKWIPLIDFCWQERQDTSISKLQPADPKVFKQSMEFVEHVGKLGREYAPSKNTLMKHGKVILICGLPGAGKTTLAKKLEVEKTAIRFCPDEWMEELGSSLWDNKTRNVLEQRFWRPAQKLALVGNTVILENGFWGRSERDGYLRAARKLGILIELRYLDVSINDLRNRLVKRGMEGDEVIAKDKLEQYFADFDRPDAKEMALYDN